LATATGILLLPLPITPYLSLLLLHSRCLSPSSMSIYIKSYYSYFVLLFFILVPYHPPSIHFSLHVPKPLG
jgi:hypothetical protein